MSERPYVNGYSRRSILKAGGALGLGLLAGPALSACAGSSSSSGRSSSGKLKQQLNWSQSAQPKTLDPAAVDTGNERILVHNVYDRLVEQTKDGNGVTPSVAKSWKLGPDGTSYTFYLRQDVKFEDGSKLDANAVVTSLRRVEELGLQNAELLSAVVKPENITAQGDYVVSMKLERPFEPLLQLLGTDTIGCIINPAVLKAHSTQADPHAAKYFANNMMGSGAFRMGQWNRGQYVQLAASPTHWRGKAQLERLNFMAPVNEQTAVLQLQGGDLDVSRYLSPHTVQSLTSKPDLDILYTENRLGMVYWAFQTQLAQLADPRVRQAICYAIDYDGIMQTIVGKSGARMDCPVPTWLIPGADKDSKVIKYNRDVAKAKSLLSAAGLSRGFSLENTYVPGYGALDQIAVVIQNNLKDVGIDCKVVSSPIATVVQNVTDGKLPFFSWLGSLNYESADDLFYNQLSSKAPKTVDGNISRYANPQLDQLVFAARQEPDAAKRNAMYLQAAEIVSSEPPWVPLYQNVTQVVTRKAVHGLTIPAVVDPDFFGVSVSA
jgi:peptide/nickel transport system substrate-binding protein